MIRQEELRSVDGQAGLAYYQEWMRSMKRMVPSAEAFASSRYFRAFVSFAQFVKRVRMPKPEKFIAWMVTKDIPPSMWTTNDVYSMYLEYLDHNTSGIESAMLSLETLFAYSEKNDIPIDKVFVQMPINDVIRLIQLRKLSPWVLLFSKTFKDALMYRASPEQRAIIESLVKPEYWIDKMARKKQDVEQIKRLISEMGI